MQTPKHPEYAMESTRMASFHSWGSNMPQRADILSKAGFYYTGTYAVKNTTLYKRDISIYTERDARYLFASKYNCCCEA